MRNEEVIIKEIKKLEAERQEREESLPAHSVRPHQLLEIEDIETAIEEKKKELEEIRVKKY